MVIRNNELIENESEEVNFNSNVFEKGIHALIKEAGGPGILYNSFGGVDNFINRMIKPFYEALLKAEMDEHLGYEHGRRSDNKNARNGTNKKVIRGDFGEAEITTPRDRDGTFQPKIVQKRDSNVGNFSDKIVSLYARGMTTREIESHLKDVYQVEVSPQFISRATDEIQAAVVEWQGRQLEEIYPIVYVDGLRVSVKQGDNRGQVIKKCVYVVLGVDINGHQDVLGLWIAETEGAKFWLTVFNDLKARGVEDILILCGDGLTGLPNAVEAVFPKTDVQLCIVHHIRNVIKFIPYKDRKEFCNDMRPIYTSPTIELAELALQQLKEKWGKKYLHAINLWERNWILLTAFYKYPVELRTIIYTTNSIESLNAQLRKNIANRKVFPNDEALIKLLFLNIRNFTKKWTVKKNWSTILSQLIIMFDDRISKHTSSAFLDKTKT